MEHMGKHIKNERLRLSRQRDKALEAFRIALPGEYERFISAEASLREMGSSEGRRYAECNRPQLAARAVLEYEQAWLTPSEIADLAHRGGVPGWDPERGQALFVQSLKKNIQRGHFVQIDGKVGLPEWKYPAADETELE